MMNTELKKMNTEALELVAGGRFLVDWTNEKVEDSLVDSGLAIEDTPEITDIYTNW